MPAHSNSSCKIINLLIMFVLLIIARNIAFADDTDSTTYLSDSTSIILDNDITDKEIGFYLIGGLGLSGGPSISSIMYPFDSSPAINLGIELPTSNHLFSLELKGFYWVAKSKYELNKRDHSYFIKLSKDIYSLYWFSADVKYFFSDKTNKFRIAIHLGYLFLCSNRGISGLDIGLGANYILDELNYMNLTYSGCLDRLPGSPMTFGYLPTVFMLNFCHNFKW